MPKKSNSLTPFNNFGAHDITIGEEGGRRSERVTPEDIRGEMTVILTADDEARQLDDFIKNPSIVLDPEVSEVYLIINKSDGQNVSIIPSIEAALINARLGVILDQWLVRLLIPAYKDGKLSTGLYQKVKHAIDSQPMLYSDTQGGRRRYKSKKYKRTSKKHKRTYKKYKRTSKKHK
jgi:hypothetical protein